LAWPPGRLTGRRAGQRAASETARVSKGKGRALAIFVATLLAVLMRPREVGPKSIHKEARFLIDHAPCPVLVVKG
jgi:hypothetical protein